MLSSIHLCYPRLTPLLQSSFLTASLLAILATTEEAISMKDGAPTNSTTEGTCLLYPNLIFATSLASSIVMVGKATDKAIGSAIEGKIHAADCAKHSAIQPLTTLHSSIEAMDNILVQIWCCLIFPQQVSHPTSQRP